ncbi:DUF4118 domain-containing protein [Azoarcus olearius]|uniref:histidine kinase n=1 Tax=Azoarcus sp. (strain BH72) TaxID=418699 RepID=A1K9B0_AZOSB|nr:DUF4118 domain-containing protein [Azoarcus olearius]CAL95415.1 probable two component sensor protein [Azoarcus olearius]
MTAAPPVPPTPLQRARPYLAAVAGSVLVTVCAAPLRHVLDPANIAMLFLLAVFLAALRLGRGPAVAMAFANTVLLDYVIVPPHFAFIPTDLQYLVTLVVMLTVGLVTARLSTGLGRQTRLSASQERDTSALYELAHELAGCITLEQIRRALDGYLTRQPREVRLLLPDDPPAAAASVAIFPLQGTDPSRGELHVRLAPREAALPAPDSERFRTVASLLATAIERVRYVELAESHAVAISSERLRTSVLAALSHDLRTPMTVLIGLADSLVMSRDPLPPEAHQTATSLLHQARALSGILNNVLDMARLHSGTIRPRREWHLLDDVIAASVRLLKPQLSDHPIRVRLEPDLPLVEFDATLLERVVCNLIDNAAKYSPAGAPIEITAFVDAGGNQACIEVCDQGEGFPAGNIDRLFELFERGNTESSVPGMGLGLSICQRIMAAHGGSIAVRNRERGACVQLRLPLGTPPVIYEE